MNNAILTASTRRKHVRTRAKQHTHPMRNSPARRPRQSIAGRITARAYAGLERLAEHTGATLEEIVTIFVEHEVAATLADPAGIETLCAEVRTLRRRRGKR